MQRVGDVLKAFFAGRLSAESGRVVELVGAWPELAGKAGEHSRVRDVRSRTLVVEVDHPGWAQLLCLRKGELLSALRRRFPDLPLEEIRLVVGSGAKEGGGPAAPSRAGFRADREEPTSPAEKERMEDTLARLPDESLRRRLRQMYDRAEGQGEGKA